MATPALPWTVAAIATLVAIVLLIARAWAASSRRSAARVRVRRAMEGEARAEPLLRSAGYEVLARQVAGEWTLRANGEPLAIALRADLLVAKDGRRYVAEVKTGRLAPRLDHAPTRRQLLEYSHAFDADGVLLVDAEEERVIEVDLRSRSPAPSRAGRGWVTFGFGAIVGAAVVLWFAR